MLDLSTLQDPLSDSGRWVNGYAVPTDDNWNNMKIANGTGTSTHILCAASFVTAKSVPNYNDYSDPIAHVATSYQTFNPNQYAEATLWLADGYTTQYSHEIELLLRFAINTGSPGNARGYEILWAQDGMVKPVRWNGPRGEYTDISGFVVGEMNQPAAHVTGSKLRVEISGTVITAKIDTGGGFSTIWTLNVADGGIPGNDFGDEVWATGQPGMGAFPRNEDAINITSKGWSTWKAGNL